MSNTSNPPHSHYALDEKFAQSFVKMQIGCSKCDRETSREYCQTCGSCIMCGIYHGKLDTRCTWCTDHNITSKEELTTHHCCVCDEDEYERDQYELELAREQVSEEYDHSDF